MTRAGVFVAIVGPSGAGKDAVIGYARRKLATRPGVIFPRRCITRADGAGEDHESCTEAEFAAASARGEFAVTWRAHGLGYGIPGDTRARVAAGSVVVANVSRSVLPCLDTVYGRSSIVRITASDEVRRARILARGRERAAAVERRMRRADPEPGHPVDLEIVNEGALERGGRRLIAHLESLLGRFRA